MNYILGALLIGILTFMAVTRPSTRDHWQMGYEAGKKEALKTNPPSEDLELVCAGLWVGEQNKKYWNKQNAR